jgi:hypothetical protein
MNVGLALLDGAKTLASDDRPHALAALRAQGIDGRGWRSGRAPSFLARWRSPRR